MINNNMENFVKSKYMDFFLFAGYKNDYVHRTYIQNGGSFDMALAKWIINNVKPGWIVYDIGANMFEITELAARMSGEKGVVRSFEPQKDLVEKYELAKSMNNYENVATIYVYPFGLGQVNEIKKIMIDKNNLGAATFYNSFIDFYNLNRHIDWDVQYLEIKRFDSIGITNEIPDLIKMDIEGGEEYCWNASNDSFKKAKYIIIESGPYTNIGFLSKILENRDAYNLDNMKPISISEIVLSQKNILLIHKNISNL